MFLEPKSESEPTAKSEPGKPPKKLYSILN